MTFDMSKGSFKYTLEEIFNNMPTKLEIENKFYDRMVQLNKANKLLFKKNIIDEEFEPRFIIMEGNQDFFKSLSEDDEKRYHTELSLERAKQICRILQDNKSITRAQGDKIKKILLITLVQL